MKKVTICLAAMGVFVAASGAGEVLSSVGTNWSVRVDADKVIIRNDTSDAARGITCRWAALREGRPVARGVFSLEKFRVGPLPAHSEIEHPLPPVVNELRAKGGEVSLETRFCRAGDARARACLQTDFLPIKPGETLPPCETSPDVTEDAGGYSFAASGVTYVFSKRTGLPKSIKTGSLIQTEWLKSPADFEGLVCEEAIFSDMTNEPGCARFGVVSRWRRSTREQTRDDSALAFAARWVIRGDGAVVCQGAFVWDGRPFLEAYPPCRFTFDKGDSLVEYFGLGSGGDGAGLRRHAMTSDATAKSGRSGSGLREGARSVSFDAGWDHLSFATCGDPFRFTVGVRSPDDMAFALCAVSNRMVFVMRPEKAEGAVWVEPLVPPEVVRRAQRGRGIVLYKTPEGALPQVALVDLAVTSVVRGVTFIPATQGGRVKDFNLEVSRDGNLWQRVLTGTLADDPNAQYRALSLPVEMRYWRLSAESAHGGTATVSLPEVIVDVKRSITHTK